MFKKFCIFIAAIFTMLISCAGPIMTQSHAETSLSIDKINADTGVTIKAEYLNYLFADISDDNIKALSFSSNRDTTDYSVIFENNVLVITYLKGNTDTLPLYTFVLNGRGEAVDHVTRCHSISFDFNNNTFSALYADGSQVLFNNLPGISFYNFETDFEEYKPSNLDLEVRFDPVLSGVVSRSQTINGKEYTSNSLDLYVTNHGSDAQFALFIVPSGGSVTFPSTNLNNSGFNPEGVVYAFVADEWSSFNVGFIGTQIQAPCTWHSVPSGYTNQCYSIPWNQMDLAANTQYDVVVYGCLNDTMTQINNVSNGWDMRGTFSVSSSLNDVTEVYRSTFSITDPAKFEPDSVNESGATHSWNSNTDNNALFNSSSAYRDDNGNIVIRGQTSGGNNSLTSFWDNSNFSINGMFGQYFMFLNGVFMFFPSPWQAIVTCGLITLVIIGILKAVT